MRPARLLAIVSAITLATLTACTTPATSREGTSSSTAPPESVTAPVPEPASVRASEPDPAPKSAPAPNVTKPPDANSPDAKSIDAKASGAKAPDAKAPAPAATPTQQPPPAAQNRDKLAPADVDHYIANLQNEARVKELKVDVVLQKLDLPDDAVVGDLGCGPGIFTLAFARACPNGVIYASDIEPAQLDVVRKKIRDTNRRNVVPVLASEDDAHFPPAQLDVVFVADTYHHLDNRVSYLRRLAKALKPGGRLVILDYKPGPLKIGPPPEHKLAAGVMNKELVEAGWKQVEKFDTHPYHDFEVWRLVQPWEK